MSLLSNRLVRCASSANNPFPGALQDQRTGQTPETVRGNATRFEFGFFSAVGVLYDLSDVESVNLKLLPGQTIIGTLADQTLAAEDLDLTLDTESWADGSKAHAAFEFTNAEMNIDPQGVRRSLWLVVTAIMTSGSEVTLAAGNFFIHEDNNAAADPPPENPGTAITLEQADARYTRGDPPAIIGMNFTSGEQAASVTGGAAELTYITDPDGYPLLLVVSNPAEATAFALGYDPYVSSAIFDFGGAPNIALLDLEGASNLATIDFRNMGGVVEFQASDVGMWNWDLTSFTGLETFVTLGSAPAVITYPSPCVLTTIELSDQYAYNANECRALIDALYAASPPDDGVFSLGAVMPSTTVTTASMGAGNIIYTLTPAALAAAQTYSIVHRELTATDGPIGISAAVIGNALTLRYIPASTAITTAISFSGTAYLSKTVSGNTTFTVSGKAANKSINLSITMSGAYTVTWPSGGDAITWAAGAPTLANGTTTQVVLTVAANGTTINGSWAIAANPAASASTGTACLAALQAASSITALATVTSSGTISGAMTVFSGYLGYHKLYALMQRGWTFNDNSP
jgi:hypothetical protein